jgi:hypothetical protein
MVRTVHSAAAAVLDVELEVEDEELCAGAELDVVSPPGVVVVDTVVVDEVGDVVVVVSTKDEVTSEGATATGLSPTWESARPTICHVKTVVRTRAATHAAAIRQLIMSQLSQDHLQCGVNTASRLSQDR